MYLRYHFVYPFLVLSTTYIPNEIDDISIKILVKSLLY